MSENLRLSIEIIAAVGSFLSGIVMLITMIRVVSRLKFKEEVIFGDEAKYKYKKLIDDKILNDGNKSNSYKYTGGKNKIFPQLEFEKCFYNSITMDSKFKKCTKRVRYFNDDDNMVHTWYLK